MTKDYDYEFGPGGTFAWPSDLDVAKKLLEAAPYEKSSADCLDDDFFSEYLAHLDKHLFEDFPEEEAYELAEAAVKARQELFKDAVNWPLPYLVASAVYKMLSTEGEEIHMISDLWDELLWPFLCFDEPLFGMLRAKGWGKIYRKEIREGFKLQLRFEIGGLTTNELMWGNDKDKPWLALQDFASHIYAEDLLRCLDLVGIDPDRAHSAVDKVFKLQSLTPLYRVLSYKPSSTRPTGFGRKRRDEEGRGEERRGREGRGGEEKTKSLKKPLGYLPIYLRNFIYGALLVAVAAIAPNRLRLSRSNWTLTRPGPCFATMQPTIFGGCFPFSKKNAPRMRFTGPGLVSSLYESSLQKRQARTNEKRWKLYYDELSVNPSQSQRIDDASSIGPSGEAAEQVQPNVGPSSEATQQVQPLVTQGSVVEQLQTLVRTLSDDTRRLWKRHREWADDGRILFEQSPEIKEWRKKLAAKGEALPPVTHVCVHLKRTKRWEKAKFITEITFTTQGTLTERWAVGKLTKLLEKYLVIDNVKVKSGARHEYDHVTFKHTASMTDGRHDDPLDDRSAVIIMTKKRHKTRTDYNKKNPPTFKINDYTAQLSDLLIPNQESDKKFWANKQNAGGLVEDDLTPKFVARQYERGHKFDQVRMELELEARDFTANQATAALLTGKGIEAIRLGEKEFLSSRVNFPALDEESAKTFSQLSVKDQERVYLAFAQFVRERFLPKYTKHRARCAKLFHSLEMYSESLAGREEGWTESQTKQYREAKNDAINGFPKILEQGKIPKEKRGKARRDLLLTANVKKDGTLRANNLSKSLSKQSDIEITRETIGEIKAQLQDCLCKVGLDLHLNTMLTRGGVYRLEMPKKKARQKLAKKAIEVVLSRPIKTSTGASAQGSAGASDQVSTRSEDEGSTRSEDEGSAVSAYPGSLYQMSIGPSDQSSTEASDQDSL